MIFKKTLFDSVYIIEIEKQTDFRGFFGRAWCKREFEAYGLKTELVQSNVGFSRSAGTLRGLHYQSEPHAEVKLVRCVKGSIYDVMIDMRPQSSTYMQWLGIELKAESYRMIYVPEGFAHGYLTLKDNTEVMYQVSEYYTPGSERGIRFNDPAFAIRWPEDILFISDKDLSWQDFSPGGRENETAASIADDAF
jgi:dTDP-4-dehydrorhamnose 3,5-epimerase